MFKTFVIGAVALVLASCALKPHDAARPIPNEGLSVQDQRSPGKLYRVDGSRSELRILVYRAGPLARLGHNHVMVNRSLSGTVNLADAPDASEFRLIVPVAGFVVDDAQARHEEGSDFDARSP